MFVELRGSRSKDEMSEIVEWLTQARVQLVRFANGQVGKPEDLLLNHFVTSLSVNIFIPNDEDAAYFLLKYT